MTRRRVRRGAAGHDGEQQLRDEQQRGEDDRMASAGHGHSLNERWCVPIRTET
jgi:hypothetical protein